MNSTSWSATYLTRLSALTAAAALVAGIFAGPAEANPASSKTNAPRDQLICMTVGKFAGCVSTAELRSVATQSWIRPAG